MLGLSFWLYLVFFSGAGSRYLTFPFLFHPLLGLSAATVAKLALRPGRLSLHLLALGIGLGAIWSRSRALRGQPDAERLRRAFYADTLWAVAAGLWIGTGLVRAFGGLEKGTEYYLASNAFLIKVTLLGLILLLEIWPMVTLIRGRIGLRRGQAIDTRPANRLARISLIQGALVIGMVFAATAMARGLGA